MFCGRSVDRVLQRIVGRRISLTYLKGILKFWEDMRLNRERYNVMVNLKGQLKGETEKKLHMLPLVDITDSGIEAIR